MASAWTTSMLGDPAPQPTYSLRSYRAWDAPTRWFHWINAVLVAALSILGIALLTGRKFGVGTEGRDLLERFHVMLGFALTINLLWRFYWAFHGNRYAQWRAILPMGPRYLRALQAYVASFVAGHPKYYVGHNPLARLGVAFLLALLTAQVLTGLLLVGIDPMLPPPDKSLDAEFSRTLFPEMPWLIGPSTLGTLLRIRVFCLGLHIYVFYALIGAVALHVAAVVATELREGGDLVSAMVTGRKSLRGPPEDSERPFIRQRQRAKSSR